MIYKKQPLVSIVMTTYNAQPFIEKQLNSILNQTYPNIKIIICDDLSSDNTLSILKRYQDKYTNIDIHINSVQLGVVKNFEKGINLAQSNYIALSDQDDIWRLDKIELQMNYMLHSEKLSSNSPILIHSDLTMININDSKIYPSYMKYRNYTISSERDLSYILGPCSIMGNTILMNRKLIDIALPFPEPLQVHDYWLALINELYGKRITIREPLVYYRIHNNNVSNSQDKLHLQPLKFLKHLYTRNFKLPYLNIKRDAVLKYLLENYSISKEDKKLISYFLQYLEQVDNRVKLIYILLKYKFIKKGFLYRSIILLGILLQRRGNYDQ